MKIKRCLFLLGIIIALLIVFLPLKFLGNDSSSPNIILITFDALRADHMGVYGYSRNTTPEIDKFAKNAFVFTNSISQCGTTPYSLLSLLFSRYPNEALEGMTLQQLLKKNGYYTIGVVAHKYANSSFIPTKGFDIFDEDMETYEASLITSQRAISRINQAKEPFFIWIHFKQPHRPYAPTEENLNEVVPGSSYFEGWDHEEIINLSWQILYYKTELEKQQMIALYDGNIRRGDDGFSQLFNYLNESGYLKNSMIIVGADHAESLGERGYFNHNDLYYTTLNTPLIIYIPNTMGKTIDAPVSNIDIYPTIASLLNLGVESLRGRDLFGNLSKEAIQYAAYPDEYKTIKQGNWQLIVNQSSISLFNLAEDPGNQNVLSTSSEKGKALLKTLSQFESKLDLEGPEESILARLKALGYI